MLLLVATVCNIFVAAGPPKEIWNNLESIMATAIQNNTFPGAVFLVADRKWGILYSNAFGRFTYDPSSPPMTLGSKFDVASVSKVIGATSATALLYQKGLLRLEDRVTKYFPDFGVNGKEGITIENLLLHNSGFAPDPRPDYSTKEFGCPASQEYNPPQVWTCSKRIYNSWINETLENKIGQTYVYSDLSMISMMFVIGNIVMNNMNALAMQPAYLRKDCMQQSGIINHACYYEAFVRIHVLENLLMGKSGFIPLPSEKANIPPTWMDTTFHHELIQGYVSDTNCYALGGVSGHAGLFAPITDMYRFMNELMFRTRGGFLNETTFNMFTTVKNTAQSSRALGW